MSRGKINPKVKVWLEHNGAKVLDETGASILNGIMKYGKIVDAAQKLGYSYRFIWNYLRRIEKLSGLTVVESYKGGFGGGGKTVLTSMGREMLRIYVRLSEFLNYALKNKELWTAYGLRTEERNILAGKVLKIEKGGKVASLKVKIGKTSKISSIITSEAIKELGLKKGLEVKAVIKATEVMIDKEKW